MEDVALVTGQGRYTGDLQPAGTTHLALVRSPYAHATVGAIDTSEAERAAGVVLVIRPEDVADIHGPPAPNPRRNIPLRFPLAQGTVLMVGDPVVAVVAETPQQALDAAELVDVDYEPLAAVGDPEEAIDSPPIHPEMEGNVAYERKGGDPAALESLAAATIVEGTIEHPRVVPNPLETRSVLAEWRDGVLTVHLSSQAPHLMAQELAKAFGMAQSSVRVVTPFVGGAFGCKFDLAEEEMLAVIAARRCRRPVRWVESRRDHIAVIGHGRAQRHHYRAMAGPDGRILELGVDSIVDLGCRQRYLAPVPSTPRIGTGPYDIGVYAWRQRGVYTNRAPMGIYRGAGRPEATLTLERVIDRIAGELGLDPAEVRRVNMVGADRFPYASAGGYTFDSGDYPRALDRLLELSGYAELRRTQDQMRRQGRYLGIGLGAYVEACGFEEWEAGRVTVHPDGSVTASAGTLDQGQGHRTAFAQIVAAELGIEATEVRVEQGDTASAPYGWGTSGSRSVAHGGSGVLGAARLLAAKLRRIAAHALEAAPEDVVLSGGVAAVKGTDVSVGWEELVGRAWSGRQLTPGEEPGLEEEHHFVSGGLNFPFGIHLAVVEVDPSTGDVDLQQIWAVDDAGVIVNPMLAAGQRHGGLAQGIGQAMWEEVRYDPDGNLLTASMVDYLLPTAARLPSFGLGETCTPSPTNPLGAKGVAEAGTLGSTPAVLNAVVDALSPLGVTDLQIPLRAERVWQAIQRAQGAGVG
jgi:aerobic carbon-monoxide dehydrogenase large subunit